MTIYLTLGRVSCLLRHRFRLTTLPEALGHPGAQLAERPPNHCRHLNHLCLPLHLRRHSKWLHDACVTSQSSWRLRLPRVRNPDIGSELVIVSPYIIIHLRTATACHQQYSSYLELAFFIARTENIIDEFANIRVFVTLRSTRKYASYG